VQKAIVHHEVITASNILSEVQVVLFANILFQLGDTLKWSPEHFHFVSQLLDHKRLFSKINIVSQGNFVY